MGKTRLKIADRKDFFLDMTRVENLFISEFLPAAPGEYVKVYIFALMYAKYEEEIDSLVMAKTLGLEERDIEEAWDYWEARGLVKRSKDGDSIEFLRMVERFYGKNRTYAASETETNLGIAGAKEEELPDFDDEHVDAYRDFDDESIFDEEDAEDEADEEKTSAASSLLTDEQLRMIFNRFQEVAGRTISRKETDKFVDAIKVYGIKAELLYYAIDYCADINNYSPDYIFKVALRWKEEGCEDIAAVKELLESRSERSRAYRDVFKAIGFNRLPIPADREIMDRWFDEMGFSLDEVLEACNASGGIREPSLRYVNKVLENMQLEKGGINTRPQTDQSYRRGGYYTANGDASAAAGRPQGAGIGSGSNRSSGSGGNSGAKVSRKVLKDFYEHIRKEEEEAHAARLREAVVKVPGMEDVFDKEAKLNSEFLSTIGGGQREKRDELREERRKLEERKKSLLASAGYPSDYLERRYRCNICKDTGFTDEGKVCSCCRARADEAYMWNLEKSAN